MGVNMTRESRIESEEAIAAARRESDEAGDVYYRTITDWLVSRLANGTGQKCYALAVAYDSAIDRLIDRLKSRVMSAASLRGIGIAFDQKSLLEADLNYLTNALMPFPKVLDSPVEASPGRQRISSEVDKIPAEDL